MAISRAAAVEQPIVSPADDALNFVPRYAVPLVRRIDQTSLEDSLTVGIYGPWGSGKTSLMNLMRGLMEAPDQKPSPWTGPPPVTVRYNAWKYNQEESLWRTMVRVVLDELLAHSDEDDEEKRALRKSLYGDVQTTRRRLRVDWPRLVGGLISAASVVLSSVLTAKSVPVAPATEVTLAGAALGGAGVLAFGLRWAAKPAERAKEPGLAEQMFTQAKDLAQAFQVVEDVLTTHHRVQYMEQFSDSFELVVNRFLNSRKLVVFIDDLDRCMPEKAIQVLEGIKLFLGVPGTVFVVGVDVAALVHAVEHHYSAAPMSPMSGGRYLEKIIQFPFHLPSIRDEDFAASELVAQLRETDADQLWLNIAIAGFGGNPRALKKFADLFRSRLEVLEAGRVASAADRALHLAKLVVLQQHHEWTDVIEIILNHTSPVPRSLLRYGPLAMLEQAALDDDQRSVLLAADGSGVSGRLARFARDDALMRFLRTGPQFDGDDPVDPLPLIRLSGVSSADAPTALSFEQVQRDIVVADPPTRAAAVAGARNLSPQLRRRLVEWLLAEVAGRSQSSDPDADGLPEAVDALTLLFRQDIERELIGDRIAWFTALSAYTSSRPSTSADRSRQRLLALMAELEEAPRTQDLGGDQPGGEDVLGTTKHVRALALTMRESATPFTVGVFGPWGSGKSFFLKLLEAELDKDPTATVSWVNLWHSADQRPLRTLVSAIGDALKVEPQLKEQVLTRLEGDERIPHEPASALHFLLDGRLHEDGPRVVLLLDELDRCPPQFVNDLLDDVHLLMAFPGLVVVLAADAQWLKHAIKGRYGSDPDTAAAYLDKVVMIPFTMPEMPTGYFDKLLTTPSVAAEAQAVGAGPVPPLTGKIPPDARIETFGRYLRSPREAKKFLYKYRYCITVFEASGEAVDFRTLAVVLLVASRWGKLLANLDDLRSLWISAGRADLAERPQLIRAVDEQLEILDAGDVVDLLADERVPTPAELDRLLREVGRVSPYS